MLNPGRQICLQALPFELKSLALPLGEKLHGSPSWGIPDLPSQVVQRVPQTFHRTPPKLKYEHLFGKMYKGHTHNQNVASMLSFSASSTVCVAPDACSRVRRARGDALMRGRRKLGPASLKIGSGPPGPSM